MRIRSRTLCCVPHLTLHFMLRPSLDWAKPRIVRDANIKLRRLEIRKHCCNLYCTAHLTASRLRRRHLVIYKTTGKPRKEPRINVFVGTARFSVFLAVRTRSCTSVLREVRPVKAIRRAIVARHLVSSLFSSDCVSSRKSATIRNSKVRSYFCLHKSEAVQVYCERFVQAKQFVA